MSELYSMLKAKKTGASSGGGGGTTVNNATITIQKNGTTVDSFTSNQATDKTINITVPTSAADVSAIPTTAKGANSGVAELDANGKIPSSQLPSYVDDVIEGYYYDSKFYEDSEHTTEITGTTGKIYVDLPTNKTYRWSGSGYTEISESLALGETSSTAYRGDRGKTAYGHATDSSRHTTAETSGLYKIATTEEGHIASVESVQKSDITELGIPEQDTTVGSGIVLTGYPSESPAQSDTIDETDTVNEAIKKLDERSRVDENNISSTQADIAAIKNGENLDSFGDVETALAGKADTTDIPTVPITAIQKNGTGITPVSGTVNITVPTSAADVSALPDTTKYAAALSLTINSSTYVMTGQLEDQNGDNLGTAQTIDLPLESVVVGGSYNSQTKKVVLTLQNGNTIEFSVADLVSGLQTELSASNKLNPSYINYDSTHRAVSDTEKSTWNGKQNAIDNSHKLSADLVDDTNATNKFATVEELEQIQTNKNNILLVEQNIRKNIATINNGTNTAVLQIPVSAVANKSYQISIGTLTSEETSAEQGCRIALMNNADVVSNIIYMARGNNKTGVLTTTGSANSLWIYASGAYQTSTGKSVTVANLMLCDKALYDAGYTDYQPYIPTIDDIMALINQ